MATPSEAMRAFMQQDAEMLANIHRQNARGTELHYHGLSDLIRREGEEMEVSKSPIFMGAPKLCFMNAFHFAREYDLTYVEGLAWNGIFPVHHAWVEGIEFNYDVTWTDPDPAKHAYIGLRMPWRAVERVVFRRGYYGVLDDWQNGWPAMQQPWSIERLVELYENLEPRR